MRPQSQNNSPFRLLLCVLPITCLSACDDAKPPTPVARVTPVPAPQPVIDYPIVTQPVPPAPTPPAGKPAAPNEEPPENPATLAGRFRASSDPQERGEIAQELWNLDTPVAVETLRQLFMTEREADVKVDMIAGITDSKNPQTRESRFGLVVAALNPSQPKDVREIGIQMLVEFEDPRALALLQQYSQDVDPDVRDAAREALETRKDAEQP